MVEGQGLNKILAKSNCKSLDLNLIANLIVEKKLKSVQDVQNNTIKVKQKFEESKWYKGIVYYLMNLKCCENLYKP